ncbi:hypothetical protein D082_30260 [Synechocystis sp. PCC 6714]|nr:hypothetical protein D082_30260 [Synechocystis sp. PCC 6714]
MTGQRKKVHAKSFCGHFDNDWNWLMSSESPDLISTFLRQSWHIVTAADQILLNQLTTQVKLG